ncbi:MAG: prolipoprotein diacylglyceryl transferase [Actinobacteria bacterium]|nr:prolipoprotein diacylglyceryl transferase [Actinomycetota bacterium]
MTAILASVGWPVLDRIRFGDFGISPHGIGIAVGFLLGSWWVLREGPKRGVSEQHLSTMLFWALIGAVVGSRFFYVVGHFSEFDSFVDMLALWRGGLSLIGGIAGAILFALPLMKRYGYRFLQVMDSAFLGFPFGIAVGRIGDLAIGDHLGKPTGWLLAWTYEGGQLAPPYACVPLEDPALCTATLQGGVHMEVTRESARMFSASGGLLQEGIGVHQTAMYDLISSAILFAVLLWFGRKVRREGVPIMFFAIWYGVMRVVTDFLRVDKRFFGLTGSQWTTGTVALLSVAVLVWWALRPKPAPVAVQPQPESQPEPEAPSTRFVPPPEPGERPTVGEDG